MNSLSILFAQITSHKSCPVSPPSIFKAPFASSLADTLCDLICHFVTDGTARHQGACEFRRDWDQHRAPLSRRLDHQLGRAQVSMSTVSKS